MGVIYVVFLFLSIVIVEGENHRTTEIHLVIEGLRKQQWSPEEQPCFKQTMSILNNAKNHTVWAMWIWNSMQHPVGTFYGSSYNLGHYDQCLAANTKNTDVNTQYCLANVKLTDKKHSWNKRNVMGDTESFLGTTTDMNRDLSKIMWGICVPAVCKLGSAAKVLMAIYMTNPIMAVEPSLKIEYCQTADARQEFGTGFYVFLLLILLLLSAALFSTIYVTYTNPRSAISQIASSFCLKRNWLALTNKAPTNDIAVLNFTKVIVSVCTIIFHTVYFTMNGPIGNVFDFDTLLSPSKTNSNAKNFISNATLSINLFFVISGTLLMRGLMERKRPLVSLVTRYFRLIGTFTLVTFYVAAVSIYTGDGPLWQKLAGREQKASAENWLWNILMLNNFVNSENISQVITWHIPCDYQLSIMGTIIFMLWEKNHRVGKMVTILVSALAIFAPGIAIYWMELPGTLVFPDIHKILDLRKNEVFLETYIKYYHRAEPYLIGMGMGYIMTVYKPQTYRKFLNLNDSYLGFAAASLVIFKVLTGSTHYYKKDNMSLILHVIVSRLLFCLASCVLMAVIEYGSLPTMRQITQWHCFTVLNRLTYGIYVTHSLFLQHNAFSQRYTQQFSYLSQLTYAVGVYGLTVVVAVLLWLFVEAPLSNLINLTTQSRVSKVKEVNKNYINKKTENNHLE